VLPLNKNAAVNETSARVRRQVSAHCDRRERSALHPSDQRL